MNFAGLGSHGWLPIERTQPVLSPRTMKFTLPPNAFPDVELSQEHQDALIEETDTVVKEIVAANEAFLADGAAFRESQWSHVRSKDGLNVFRQRRRSRHSKVQGQGDSWSSSSGERGPSAERDTTLSSSSAFAENTIMERMMPPGVSLMALHGTVDGNLDDCMYGCFASTDEAWKLRSSHINDRLDDARILATIRGPTRQDPFRFLGAKWFAKEIPALLSTIVQQRDFVILESSGLTLDSKGQRVGYFLMHSVALRAIPELTDMGIVRGKMSFCYIFRQGGPGKVQVYTLGFFDSNGDMPDRVSVSLAADAAICCAGVVDYAYIKKLAWLMRNSSARSGPTGDQSNCESCHKSLTKWCLSSGACRICRRAMCGKCSVVKKMTVEVSDSGSVQQCAFRFCLGCLFQAKKQSVWDMVLGGFDTSSKAVQGYSTVPSTPQPRMLSMQTPEIGRRGRSYSAYQPSETCANQRREANRANYSNLLNGRVLTSHDGTKTTESPPATDASFKAWSPMQ